MAIATQRRASGWELNPGKTGKTEQFIVKKTKAKEISGNWGW